MSFEFDPTGGGLPSLPELDKIERQDDASGKQDNKQVPIRIDYDLCEDSGACSNVCPEDVIEYKNGHSLVVKPEACTECWICVENCVSGAIDIG